MTVVDTWSVVAAAGVLLAVVWWRPPVEGRLRGRPVGGRAPMWLAGKPGALPWRLRAAVGAAAGIVAWSWFGWSWWALPVGVLVAGAAAVGLGFFSSGAQGRRREQIVMALPQACDLMSVCLEAGLPLRQAVEAVAEVMDPPISDCLGQVVARVNLGVSEHEAWADLRGEPGLEMLGREIGRCLSSGVALAGVLRALAVEARRDVLSLEEVRAKRVGVRSVLPLMTCFLPAFVLLGIVPIIGGIVSQVIS